MTGFEKTRGMTPEEARRYALSEVAEMAEVLADEFDVDAMKRQDEIAIMECRSAEDAMRRFARIVADMVNSER